MLIGLIASVTLIAVLAFALSSTTRRPRRSSSDSVAYMGDSSGCGDGGSDAGCDGGGGDGGGGGGD
jgi:hypothetical protein